MFEEELKYRSTFMTRKEVIKEMGLIPFLKTRLVSPKQIKEAIKDYDLNLKEESLSSILFNARYHALKAIDGYDFI